VKTLWFIVPAHGRLELARICLRQLRRTCDALGANGIEATAIVVADDENLDSARELGFATYERDNDFVSRKFNDGIQCALDPRVNLRPADYVVPIGSDDWVDWRLFCDLPRIDTMVGFQQMAFVREDGCELATATLSNEGGSGIRIYSREIMAVADYRPADEDRARGCDTSILYNLLRLAHFRVEHRSLNPLQIVDWKSPEAQLNPYDRIAARWRFRGSYEPFETLAGIFPAEALEEMQAHYEREVVAA
jgi:hypothetical protein